jgi:hypothetical protein
MTTKKVSTKGTRAKSADELDAFAHHFAEVLRIARTSEAFSVHFSNALGDAWNDFNNEMPSLTGFYHSEEYIRLALTTAMRQRKDEKGGAR